MKNISRFLQHKLFHYFTGWCLVGLLCQPAVADDTITIGKGSGIVWEGMPFSASLSVNAYSGANSGFTFIVLNPMNVWCEDETFMQTIGGYKAYPIAPGLGLIPRANIRQSYVLADGTQEVLTGTIGLPETKAITSSGYTITNPIAGKVYPSSAWCLSPRMAQVNGFYQSNTVINTTLTGTWVIVADGRQTNRSIVFSGLGGAVSEAGGQLDYKRLLPGSVTLRVSTLECMVSTPTQIDFGTVATNLQKGAETEYQNKFADNTMFTRQYLGN